MKLRIDISHLSKHNILSFFDFGSYRNDLTVISVLLEAENTGWRTKCHTIDCAHNTFLLLQKHLTPGTELILIGWKIFPNEEHVQCDHHFASQTLAN